MAAVGAGNDLAAVDALSDLRIGINMIDLQRERNAMPSEMRTAVDTVMAGTGAYYAAQAKARHVLPAAPALLRDIDHALDVVAAMQGDRARGVLLQLVGIRRGLFADAESYRPASPQPRTVPAEETAERTVA
jgi:uncharacterized membrane protein YccC